MKSIKYYLFFISLYSFTICQSQVFTKEALSYRIEENKLFGDSIRIPVYSSKIWGFNDSGIYFEKKGNKWGLYNVNKNKLIIPHEIDSVLTVYHFPNIKSYLIKQNGQWKSIGFDKKYRMKKSEPDTGLMHSSYKEFGYKIDQRKWKRFQVIYNGKRGVMNKAYETIVSLKYEYVLNLFDALNENTKDSLSFLVYNKDKVGIITNDIYIEPKFDDVGLDYPTFVGDFGSMKPSYLKDHLGTKKLLYDKNYFGIDINDKRGIMNYNQDVIVPCIYDSMYYTESSLDEKEHEGKFIVIIEGKFGVINAQNEILIPLEYNNIEYKETTDKAVIFIVRKGHMYGLINSLNEIIKPINYTKKEVQN